jgi:hypothetical protein
MRLSGQVRSSFGGWGKGLYFAIVHSWTGPFRLPAAARKRPACRRAAAGLFIRGYAPYPAILAEALPLVLLRRSTLRRRPSRRRALGGRDSRDATVGFFIRLVPVRRDYRSVSFSSREANRKTMRFAD